MKAPAQKSEKRLREEQTLKALEEVAERLSVQVHYEDMKAFEFRVQDGCCKLKGESHIYIDRKRTTRERIQILADELRRFDLDAIYIPPLLREKVFRLSPVMKSTGDAAGTKLGVD
jgi:hypothetical protein